MTGQFGGAEQRYGRGAFPGLIWAGLACMVLGYAVPLTGGEGDRSLFAVDGEGSALVFVVFGLPILIGLFGARRSPLMLGLAAGSSLLFGSMICLVWLVQVAFLQAFDALSEVGAGIVLLAIGSVLLIAAAVKATSWRRWGRSDAGPSPVARLGTVAVVVFAVGLCIPQNGVSFNDWMGFSSEVPLSAAATLLVLSSILFAGIFGFLGGRWGAGLLMGYVGVLGVAAVVAEERSGAISSLVKGQNDWSTVAVVGLWATVILTIVQVIAVSSQGGQPDAPDVLVATSSSPARWADDPFGRHGSRYWDGGRWTEHVSDNGVTSTDAPVAGAPRPTEPQVQAQVPPPAQQPAGGFVVGSGPPPVVSAPPAEVTADHDGRTLSRAELEAVLRGVPPQPAPLVPPTPPHVLVFDDGRTVPLAQLVVVGRDPSVSSLPAGAVAQRVDDATMSVSKSHFAIGVSAGEMWVEDLGSVNGTKIVTEGGFATEVASGQRLPVMVGSTIRFGDRECRVTR